MKIILFILGVFLGGIASICVAFGIGHLICALVGFAFGQPAADTTILLSTIGFGALFGGLLGWWANS